jgi:hypothetical protein
MTAHQNAAGIEVNPSVFPFNELDSAKYRTVEATRIPINNEAKYINISLKLERVALSMVLNESERPKRRNRLNTRNMRVVFLIILKIGTHLELTNNFVNVNKIKI